MENTKLAANFEKDLLANLKARRFDKKYLSKITASIIKAHKTGVRIIDWQMYGKPSIDGIRIHAIADPRFNLSKLFDLKEWKELQIFKKGTPRPDLYDIRGKFNI